MAEKIATFQSLSGKFRQTTQLENKKTQIDFSYNTKSQSWYVTIDIEGEKIVNKKLTLGWPLLQRNKSFFPYLDGDIMALRLRKEAGEEITYTNLNNGIDVFYLTPDEVKNWKEKNGV